MDNDNEEEEKEKEEDNDNDDDNDDDNNNNNKQTLNFLYFYKIGHLINKIKQLKRKTFSFSYIGIIGIRSSHYSDF